MKNKMKEPRITEDVADVAVATAIILLVVVAFIGLILAIAIWGEPGPGSLPWSIR